MSTTPTPAEGALTPQALYRAVAEEAEWKDWRRLDKQEKDAWRNYAVVVNAWIAHSTPAGQAPAPAQESACWAVYDSQGFYDAFHIRQQAIKFCDHYNKREVDPLKPYTYKPLYATPHPAQEPADDAALIEQLASALRRLMRSFPTDSDMQEAGWEVCEINEACNAHDAARHVLGKLAARQEQQPGGKA
jgi:hypothetical protein